MGLGSSGGDDDDGDEAVRALEHSVGNTAELHESALVEAYNLKAAIALKLGDAAGAAEALADMPPRREAELDPVTLHNSALVSLGSLDWGGGGGGLAAAATVAAPADPSSAFAKLAYLVAHPPFPNEAFGNLLLLYVRAGAYDLAADVMAENAALTLRSLPADLYDLLDASIVAQTSASEAARKFGALAARHADALRRLLARAAASGGAGAASSPAAAAALLDRYLAALLGAARVQWERGAYAAVERLFRASADLASEHDTWRLHVAHTFFMQAGRQREAIRYYEPLVRARWGRLLAVAPAVLANLCVCYVLAAQNDEAEELMQRLEAEEEEEAAAAAAGAPPPLHLAIVNLVIGTLYCTKGNYDFGVTRVLRALEPVPVKLSADTWYYAKRCLLALAEATAKHLAAPRDDILDAIVACLQAVERAGARMPAAAADGRTVAAEARVLRRLFLILAEG